MIRNRGETAKEDARAKGGDAKTPLPLLLVIHCVHTRLCISSRSFGTTLKDDMPQKLEAGRGVFRFAQRKHFRTWATCARLAPSI